MAAIDFRDRLRGRQQGGTTFDSGTGFNTLTQKPQQPPQSELPVTQLPRPGGAVPPFPANPPQSAAPQGVSADQLSQLAQRAGGEDAARRWLAANPGDIQRGLTTATFGSGSGGGQTSYPSDGQFTDPIAGSVAQQAAERRNRLQNPPQGSGLQQYESALGETASQFRQGGFTPAEMEVFQTQALDPLEQLRTARKQQVMEQLARRGLNPQSGVAQSMIADVDRQFDALRSQQQRSIAGQAAQERSSRMLQSLQLLSGLAGSEEGRLDRAFSFGQVPLQLDDRAFTRGMNLYNTAGNPLSLINPLVGLGGLQQGRNDAQGAALAELIYALVNRR